jgi:hypothetical protein
MRTDMNENVFKYNLSELENETLNLLYSDEASYLMFTPPLEVLNDLHLLFLIRMDRVNCDRIMNRIMSCEEVDV